MASKCSICMSSRKTATRLQTWRTLSIHPVFPIRPSCTGGFGWIRIHSCPSGSSPFQVSCSFSTSRCPRLTSIIWSAANHQLQELLIRIAKDNVSLPENSCNLPPVPPAKCLSKKREDYLTKQVAPYFSAAAAENMRWAQM